MKEKPDENKRVPRQTRTEQRKSKEQALSGVVKKSVEEEKHEDAGLDLFEAFNILAKYDATW